MEPFIRKYPQSENAVLERSGRIIEETVGDGDTVSFSDCRIKSSLRSEILRNARDVAPFEVGDAEPVVRVHEIPWFDATLLRQGQDFARKYFLVVFVVQMLSFAMGASHKPLGGFFIRHGMLKEKRESLRVQVANMKILSAWLFTDFTSANSFGFKQLIMVRKLHNLFAHSEKTLPTVEERVEGKVDDACRLLTQQIRAEFKDEETPDAAPELLSWTAPMFSQLSVALFGFGLIFPFLLRPELISYDYEGLKGFTHFWALVSRMVGLRDTHNFLLHPDRLLFNQIFRNNFIASLKEIEDPNTCMLITLLRDMPYGASYILTPRVVLCSGLEAFLERKPMWRFMDVREKASYYLFKAVIFLYGKSSILRTLANYVFWAYLLGCDKMLNGKYKGRKQFIPFFEIDMSHILPNNN